MCVSAPRLLLRKATCLQRLQCSWLACLLYNLLPNVVKPHRQLCRRRGKSHKFVGCARLPKKGETSRGGHSLRCQLQCVCSVCNAPGLLCSTTFCPTSLQPPKPHRQLCRTRASLTIFVFRQKAKRHAVFTASVANYSRYMQRTRACYQNATALRALKGLLKRCISI